MTNKMARYYRIRQMIVNSIWCLYNTETIENNQATEDAARVLYEALLQVMDRNHYGRQI